MCVWPSAAGVLFNPCSKAHAVVHRDVLPAPWLCAPWHMCLCIQLVPAALTRTQGIVTDSNYTCTACAGTLLLEFGALSALTGD